MKLTLGLVCVCALAAATVPEHDDELHMMMHNRLGRDRAARRLGARGMRAANTNTALSEQWFFFFGDTRRRRAPPPTYNCYCDNGNAISKTACTDKNNLHRCETCHAGYHKSGSKCVENICKCDYGTAKGWSATKTACHVHNAVNCESCVSGYSLHPVNGRDADGVGNSAIGECVADTLCDDMTKSGTATNRKQHNTFDTICDATASKCSALVEDNSRTCAEYCDDHGLMCTGGYDQHSRHADTCPWDESWSDRSCGCFLFFCGCSGGDHKVDKDAYNIGCYAKNGDNGNKMCTCEPKRTCNCAHGVASKDEDCTLDGAHMCSSCDDGYHLADGNGNVPCVANVCTCPNGTPKAGADCTKHGEIDCYSCDDTHTPNGYFGHDGQWRHNHDDGHLGHDACREKTFCDDYMGNALVEPSSPEKVAVCNNALTPSDKCIALASVHTNPDYAKTCDSFCEHHDMQCEEAFKYHPDFKAKQIGQCPKDEDEFVPAVTSSHHVFPLGILNGCWNIFGCTITTTEAEAYIKTHEPVVSTCGQEHAEDVMCTCKKPNVCKCTHNGKVVGTAPTGRHCPADQAEHCSSCTDDYYHMVGTTCTPNSCSCEHGTAGTKCLANGDQSCTACMAGYHMALVTLENGDETHHCKKNKCTQCANGVADDDAFCTGSTSCSTCEFGYHLFGTTKLGHKIDGEDVYLDLQCKKNKCARKLTARAMMCNAKETHDESGKYDRKSADKKHGFLDLDPWREGSNSKDFFTIEKLCETTMRWLPGCPLSRLNVPDCNACSHIPKHKVKCSETLGGETLREFDTMCHATCAGYLYDCVPTSPFGPEGSKQHGPDVHPVHKMPMTHMLDDHIAAGAQQCDALTCKHETRRVNGFQTSSIMVEHKCIKGSDITAGQAKDAVAGFEHLYGSNLSPKQARAYKAGTFEQLGSNLGFGHNKAANAAGRYDRDTCLEEQTCEYGHYCGLNSKGECRCVESLV